MQKELTPLKPEDVKLIVVHCSATRSDRPYSVENLISTGVAKYGQASYYHKCNIIKSSQTKSADNQYDKDGAL